MSRFARVALSSAAILVITLLVVTTQTGASPIGGLGETRYGVSKRKGFDACSAPSVSRMQTWWTYTPYWDVGIYIGGSNRACSQPNLTPSWARTVHSQGWSYYLTWVGPQAPCTGYGSRFSYDTSTARQQGRNQADAAVLAAYDLGFTGRNVYYFDMEAYDTGNSSCRNAVKAFVDGWSGRIKNYWVEKAGVYGSSCGSAVADWATINNVPNDVWVADWNGDPDVWGLACLSNGLWSNDQRIHQYRGGHNETWGGVTMNIDNDCADGLVTPHGHFTSGDPACTTE